MKPQVVTFLAAVLLFHSPATGGEMPYGIKIASILEKNDFSSNLLTSEPWNISYGEWFIENGELFSREIPDQDHSPSLSLLFKMPETHLFSFDFTLSEEEGSGMRVALFGKGGFKFLMHPNRLSLSVSDKSDKENYPYIIDVKEVTLPPGEKHHVDLIVKGHQVIAIFDGEPVLAAEDPKVNDQGKRYQFSMSPGCSFDNFQLSQIELIEDAFAQVEFKKGKHSRK